MSLYNKLRIGVVLTKDYAPKVGGGFGYYDIIIREIDKYDFNPLIEFIFIQLDYNQEVKFKKEIKQFKELESPLLKKKFLFVKFLPLKFFKKKFLLKYKKEKEQSLKEQQKNWLESENIDLLYHLHPSGGDLNFPFVATHWDIGHYSMFAFPEVAMNGNFEYRESMYQTIYRKALAIFCETESGKNELHYYKKINLDRIFVVPLFPGNVIYINLKVEEQIQLILKRFSLKPKSYYLYPAQFWAHKNHYYLLLAFKIVTLKQQGLKLVLAGGDYGNLSYIKKIAESLQIESLTIFPGFISDEELYCLYKNAICLVMPTLLGPSNMPLLEAAYLGCSVITSESKGHREILGDYAEYINPLDENSIADAMLFVYEEKDRPHKLLNNSNNIEYAIKSIEKNFLKIRKIRQMWK